MPHFLRPVYLCLSLLLISSQSLATGIALIRDGAAAKPTLVEQLLVSELEALTGREFKLNLHPEAGNWTRESIQQAFQRAYANPEVDMVLAVGLAGNQIGLLRDKYPKPTFLPLVFDAEITQAPSRDQTSGINNLNYLHDGVLFSEELAMLRRLLPFRRAAILTDAALQEAVPNASADLAKLGRAQGVEFVLVQHNDQETALDTLIPAGIDAIFVSPLPRMTRAKFQRLIQLLKQRQLPSFAFQGKSDVEKGLLAALTTDADFTRIARYNALNMQAVLLGDKAEQQPISFDSKRRYVINMATARAINFSPPFELFSEAELLHQEQTEGPRYSLSAVANLALDANLQLQAAQQGVYAGAQLVNQTRAALLPQLQVRANHSQRKQSRQVDQGLFAERTSDSTIALSQVLYSDRNWTDYRSQQDLQRSREADARTTRLDIIQAATQAYLNVLRAQTGLRVQQENLRVTRINLELARNRQEVGASSAADLYRWQSRLATGRQSVLGAQASLDQTRDALNRLLGKPIKAPFRTQPSTLDNPELLLVNRDLLDLIDNQRAFEALIDYQVQSGLRDSPALQSLQQQLAAAEKTWRKERRAHWLPELSLNGQWQHNIDNNLIGTAPQPEDSDWQGSVQASLPLFTSGALTATERRARYNLEQLKLQYRDSQLLQEQNIRSNLHAIRASFPSIELAQEAATASRKNYDLVADGYAQGTVTVIELLDAQNALLNANEQAANAAYDFLIDLMQLQRETGHFDFFLTQAERAEALQTMRDYLQQHR